jgi:hypothetical protein
MLCVLVYEHEPRTRFCRRFAFSNLHFASCIGAEFVMNRQNIRDKNWRLGFILALVALLYMSAVIGFIIIH